MNRNPNIAVVKAAAKSLGAEIIKLSPQARHLMVHIRTKSGLVTVFPVQMHKAEPYKLSGWTKQHIRRAEATRGNPFGYSRPK